MTKQPLSITLNLVIILLNALIWLILGVIIAFDMHSAIPDLPGMKLGLSIISFVIVIFLLGLTYQVWKHNRTAYYLMIAFFILTSILTIFDDLGLADILFLVISMIPVILLIRNRAWYLQA